MAAAAVLAVFVGLSVLSDAFATGPQGPVSSSYATSRQGLAAWAELLQRAGRRVAVVRDSLSRAVLTPGGTLVVLDPDALLPDDGRHLTAFVRAGGRLIIGGREPDGALRSVLSEPPAWVSAADPRAAPVPGTGALAGVTQVRTAGAGGWVDSPSAGQALLRDAAGEAVLLRRRLGGGVIDLLADPSPLQNDLLASADNAALALDLAPAGAPVLFAESVHGFGVRRGLAALPVRWDAALIVLGLGGLAWVLSRARRLGPPEALPPEAAPPRRAYVDALVLVLRRVHDTGALAGLLRRAIDRELVARGGLSAGGGSTARERELRRLGADAAEVEALGDRSSRPSDRELIALGVALARVRRSR